MTTCPTCSTETHGRKCASSYCEGHADGEWEGRQAAIRDEVAYALRDMDERAAGMAQNVAAWARVLVKGDATSENHAYIVGARHCAERRRRSFVAFISATRRWLQETA